MSLRARLALWYVLALLGPAAAYLGFYRPQMVRREKCLSDLSQQAGEIQKQTQAFAAFPLQLAKLMPPKPPPVPERLAALAALRMPGLVTEQLSMDPGGTLKLGLRGGYREVVGYLEAVQALPFAVRMRFLELAPSSGALEGSLTVEVGP